MIQGRTRTLHTCQQHKC